MPYFIPFADRGLNGQLVAVDLLHFYDYIRSVFCNEFNSRCVERVSKHLLL